MRKVNKKPYIFTIVFLLIIILGLAGYIAYDYFFANEKNETNETILDNVKIDLNVFYQIGYILDCFDDTFNKTNNTYFGYLYNYKKLEVKNFDLKAALYTSMKKNLIISNTNQTLLDEKVKGNYKKIFGTAIIYNSESIDAGNLYKITYDATTKTYTYTIPLEANNKTSEYITKNIKTRVEDDKVIVTRKVFYVEYSNNSAVIYKTKNKEKIGQVSLKNGEVDVEEVIGKYGSKINTYDYTFIENKSDDYTFYKIEQLK